MKLRANGIEVEVIDRGEARDAGGKPRPVVLLIMGLGMQLVAWPPALVDGLIEAGYRVVCFDNRDVGLSQHFDELGMPNLIWEGLKYKLGWRNNPAYTLHDMALDALGVLDALAIDKAHVVGVSMGGMIAQRLALKAPSRLYSLVSIMSSSGARGLPAASREVTRQLLSRPAGKSKQDAIDHSVKLFKAIGSVGFPMDDAFLRERVTLSTNRSFHPEGISRQMVAVVADRRRADELKTLKTPTLVIHGKADPLVPYACGEDTARRIPGARIVGIEGMGHDLPPGVVERLLALLIEYFKSLPAQHP